MKLKNNFRKSMITLGLLLSGNALAETYSVSSAQEITDAIAAASAGDTIILADGTYNNLQIMFDANGIEGHPILLQAQSQHTATNQGVVLTGNSKINIAGDHLIVDGFSFIGASTSDGDALVEFFDSAGNTSTHADYSQLTNTLFEELSYSNGVKFHVVELMGSHNTVDNNEFRNLEQDGVTVLISRRTDADAVYPTVADFHTISGNYFNSKESPLGPEEYIAGAEGIKIGSGGAQRGAGEPDTSSFTTVENNLFFNQSAEGEIISVKADGNIIRNNTFKGNNGAIVLRNGDGNEVHGNFMDGENRAKSAGIRVIGANHKVYNNHIQNMNKQGITLHGGCTDPTENGCDNGKGAVQYRQVVNLELYNNTIVDSANPLSLASQTDTTMKYAPINSVIANNVVLLNTPAPIITSSISVNLPLDPSTVYADNVLHGSSTTIADEFLALGKTITPTEVVDNNPELSLVSGLWKPSVNSYVVDKSTNNYALADIDIVGVTRDNTHDTGAIEYSTDTPTIAPLTALDVGRGTPVEHPTPSGGSGALNDNFNAIADAYVDEGTPDANYGIDTRIKTKATTGGNRHGYLQFDVSGIDRTINSATLYFYNKNGTNDTMETFVAGAEDNWIGILLQ
jgi:poly(beta-D-mannuronate) lyase